MTLRFKKRLPTIRSSIHNGSALTLYSLGATRCRPSPESSHDTLLLEPVVAVWLVDTTLCQQCSEELLAELKRTLTAIPENSVLLLTCSSKPDGRLKSTQLLQSLPISEFS